MKKLVIIMAVLSLGACGEAVQSPAQLCEQTVKDYALYRDVGPVQAYADLFTEDGTFTLGGTVTMGHEALKARHVAANKAAAWRHNMTDIRIETDGETVKGRSRFIVMTGPHAKDAAGPSSFMRQIIGDYQDVFVIEGGACKIKSRQVNVLFDNQ